MTIASAFNEIAAAQGGTPNYSGTIAAAIDALNDALAGSDQQAASTIEGAVRLLGQHIGGGGGGTFEVKAFAMDNDGQNLTELSKSFFYPCEMGESNGAMSWVPNYESSQVSQTQAGTVISVPLNAINDDDEVAELGTVLSVYVATSTVPVASIDDVVMLSAVLDDVFLMPMPNANLCLLVIVGDAA